MNTIDFTKVVDGKFPLCQETFKIAYDNGMFLHKVLESLPDLSAGDVVFLEKNVDGNGCLAESYIFIKGSGVYILQADATVVVANLLSGTTAKTVTISETKHSITDQNAVVYTDIYSVKKAVLAAGASAWYELDSLLCSKSDFEELDTNVPSMFRMGKFNTITGQSITINAATYPFASINFIYSRVGNKKIINNEFFCFYILVNLNTQLFAASAPYSLVIDLPNFEVLGQLPGTPIPLSTAAIDSFDGKINNAVSADYCYYLENKIYLSLGSLINNHAESPSSGSALLWISGVKARCEYM